MPLRWYAAYTRHQHEKSASSYLAQKGMEVLLPLYRSLSRWKDRNKEVLLPLFPGYVFVLTDLERRVEVLRAPGVCWLVGSAGIPVAVSTHEIERVRRLTESPLSYAPHPYLKRGDRVRVLSGPLEGMEGILIRVKKQCRVVVTMDLLRQAASVEIESTNLERISATASVPLAQLARARQYS